MVYQVRAYTAQDYDRVSELILLQNEKEKSDQAYDQRIKKEDNIFVCVDTNQVLGVMILDYSENPHRGHTLDLFIASQKEYQSFIYEALYEKLNEFIIKTGSNHITVSISSKDQDIMLFWQEKGFHQWFILHFMKHNKKTDEVNPLPYRHYDNQDFEIYFKALGQAFKPMREAMDIRPYHVYEGASKEKKIEEKEELEKEKDTIYMFFNQDELIGSAILSDREIDDVFITDSYQGKGYGRKIMETMIDIAYQKNNEPLKLSVVDWNIKAKNLYQSLGFQTVETKIFYRKLIK